MATPLEPLLLGLALGVRHALEPDHLAAVGALVSGTRSARAAAGTGAWWGAGHALAILLLGSVLVTLGVRVPVRLAVVLDLAVAVMLVGLGVHAVRAHRHAPATSPASGGRGSLRSILVGFVHGASGTAAVTLLCLTTLRSRSTAIGFLALFSLGSVVSMAAMSGLLAAPLAAVTRRGPSASRWLRIGSGVIAFGAAIAVIASVLASA